MMKIKSVIFLFFFVSITTADLNPILKEITERKDLEFILLDLLNGLIKKHDVTCIAFITDSVYLNVLEGAMFRRMRRVPYVLTVVEEYEDLLSPNYDTLESLREARKEGCNVYVILLANSFQTTRLLRFGDRHRILDTRAKYIFLHDFRLFHSDLHYIWKRIVNVIFLRHHKKITGNIRSKSWFDSDSFSSIEVESIDVAFDFGFFSWKGDVGPLAAIINIQRVTERFELSTVPFPNPIRGVFVPKRVDIWNNGRFHYNRSLFADKTTNLNGEVLNVVYLDHVPSVVVMKTNETAKIGGVEIEILNTLAKKMNFEPRLYQPENADLHKWGQKQANGSFSGLLGEMVNGHADVALGNLQYTPYHLELTDMSIPYTSQCWTFVTPEALTDNSWKTLILPFKLYMWVTVLLVLLITGVIFYGLARFYMNLQDYKKEQRTRRKVGFKEKDENDVDEKPGLYLFGEIINSILYTYGMLLVVSLPKLPTGWSIRLLTGWYWLYCILLVVSYRASMTAILANPAPRVTIDTLRELVDSKVTCGGWGTETKKFFEDSLDDIGQKIGQRFEIAEDPFEAAAKVAKGTYAYYDNAEFLKYLSVKRKNVLMDVDEFDNSTINSTNEVAIQTSEDERNLHIMTDCVVNVPISVGFHKNSPLKPLADLYIRRIVEVGLVEKWLDDAMYTIRSLDTSDEEIKALMNLKKLYGAFVALGIGYFFSTICLIGELIHWHWFVKRDPNFDKYALDIYYMKKNKKH